ncbi:unnamed protein product [Mesocestoides corti]|uniref:Uncharacterized protein n=1 Tax=Mesocestoides corti TaxID=53468 RepID=A0A0R3UMK7_MESCO|nr:unnamed protein product [Mesocestoides corti]
MSTGLYHGINASQPNILERQRTNQALVRKLILSVPKKRQAPLPPKVISGNNDPVAHDNAEPSEHERFKSASNPADPESNNVTAKKGSSFSDMILKWYQSDVHPPVRQKSIQTATPSAFSDVSHHTHTLTSVGTSPVGSLDRSFVSSTFTGSLTIERGTYDADSTDCTECYEPVQNSSPSPPSLRPPDPNFTEVLTHGPTTTGGDVVKEAENMPGTASGLLSSRVFTLAERQISSPDIKSLNACEAVERFVPSADYLKDARATLKKIPSRSKSPTILSHASLWGMEATTSSQQNDARESVDWSSRFWSPEKAPSTMSFMIPK